MFVDEARIHVKAGDGGDGCVAFRREKFVPRGGPSGGNGGRGGNIVIRSTSQLNTLLAFRYRQHFKAERGRHGSGSNKTGRDGQDCILEVPVGTQVFEHESGRLLMDLAADGDAQVVARGGRGGRGNASFTTSTDQAPRRFEKGVPGEDLTLRLELKILADVGLVGFPNAGKSTLISVLSSARPRIADYPFTTLTPNLGVVGYDEYSSFLVADIPGLIEGAHRGNGLGFQFLRHVERTRILVHLVDVSELGDKDPVHALEITLAEMALYDPRLVRKRHVIVASKMDSALPERVDRLSAYCRSRVLPLVKISAATGEGIDDLKATLVRLLDEEQD